MTAVDEAPKVKWSEALVVAELRKMFAPPEWALIAQVRSAAGYDAKRTMDAMALNLWPSRGFARDGFEVKCSRSDWLKELRDGAKAEAFCRYLHRWWIVVPDASIVKPGELPPTWGLIDVTRKRKIVTQAPNLWEDGPEDLPKTMVWAMVKRCAESSVDAQVLAKAREEARQEGVAAGKQQAERNQGRAPEALERLQEAIKAFAEQTGIDLAGNTVRDGSRLGAYGTAEEIGRAVAAVMAVKDRRGGVDGIIGRAEDNLERQLATVRQMRAKLNEGAPE